MPGFPSTSGPLLSVLFDSTLAGATTTIDTGAAGFSGAGASLLVHILARTDQALVLGNIQLTLNADTGANYDFQTNRAQAGAPTSGSSAAQSNVSIRVPGNSNTAGTFGTVVLWIPAYSQTTARKAIQWQAGWADPTAANSFVENGTGLWRNTAAVTRLTIVAGSAGNLAIGSRLAVYAVSV